METAQLRATHLCLLCAPALLQRLQLRQRRPCLAVERVRTLFVLLGLAPCLRQRHSHALQLPQQRDAGHHGAIHAVRQLDLQRAQSVVTAVAATNDVACGLADRGGHGVRLTAPCGA